MFESQKVRQDLYIGDNIRQFRKKAKLTQEQIIAQMQLLDCHMTRSMYAKIETGAANIRISEMVALKRILKINFENFFEGIE